jgi:hypothetical protein
MFENEYYQEGGKSPKFKGKLTVNGVDKEFAVWPKENNGKTFFSGKISEPFVKQEKPQIQDPLKKKIEAKHNDMQEDYGDLPFS